MTPQPAADLRVQIAKFSNLSTPEVHEHIRTTWAQWLGHLATEPDAPYAGQFDHGGWSPVIYDPAHRAKNNVRSVFALVLDHDKGGNWDRVTALWEGTYALVYTTKSHSMQADRLRVVLPLARSVTSEEYAKIWEWAARRCAESGCPADRQCKDASRFWYDPSRPDSAPWRSVLLDGEAVDPDDVLAQVVAPTLRVVRPTQQPTDEQRLARARAYLAKMPGAVAGDSGHTTTFNAVAAMMFGFDLSESDTEALITVDYNPRCDPPWSERELEHKIKSAAKQSTRERGYLLRDRPRVTSTQQAAAAAPPAPQEISIDYLQMLVRKKDGTPKRGYANTAIFVKHHPDYRAQWSIDLMTGQPWLGNAPLPPGFIHEIRAAIDMQLGFTAPPADVEAAILAAANDRPFHPIRQYLSSLDWDGVPRLASMARDYLHSKAEVHAEMVRKFMIGAAARALRPGCKLDTALMLVGAQGIRKSTFFSVLGGSWHSDTFIDIKNKDGFMQLHAAWIYELAELENVVHGRAESHLKAWITSTHDAYRAPYERNVSKRARAVAICGTTNRGQFLTDDTGSRRFHIIQVNAPIPWELLQTNRDQLWAEAVCAVEAGESWWLDEGADARREEQNVEHSEEDAWALPVSLWIDGRHRCTVHDVLKEAVKLEVSKHDQFAMRRVARILGGAGWKRRRDPTPPRTWFYVKA